MASERFCTNTLACSGSIYNMLQWKTLSMTSSLFGEVGQNKFLSLFFLLIRRITQNAPIEISRGDAVTEL